MYVYILYIQSNQNVFSSFTMTVIVTPLLSYKKTNFLGELSNIFLGLHSFIRMADYLIVNTTHMLVVNSVSKLLSVFQEQNTHTPSFALIQSWAGSETSQDPEIKVSMLVSMLVHKINITYLLSTVLLWCIFNQALMHFFG